MNQHSVRHVIVLAAFLLSVLVPVVTIPTARASYQSLIAYDSEDVVWGISDRQAGSSTDFDLVLDEFKDLNNDGDFADTGETTNIINAADVTACTGAAASPHVSCDLIDIANEQINVVWRNASVSHKQGNYTFTLTFEDAVNTVVVRHLVSVRIMQDVLTQSVVDTLRENLRAQAQTVENNETVRWQQLNNTLDLHDSNITSADFGAFADNQDVVIHIDSTHAGVLATKFSLTLDRVSDLNTDGDLADTGESTTLAAITNSASTHCGAVATILSCIVTASAQRASIVFQNASASHIVGNYTLTFEWVSAGNDVLRTVAYSFRIVPTIATASVLQTAWDDLRSQIHTFSDNSTLQHRNIVINASDLQETVVYEDSQDVVIQLAQVSSVTPNSLTIGLRSLRDLNTDGDFLDPNENEMLAVDTITGNCQTSGILNVHFSCDIALVQGYGVFIWRASASSHTLGNYSIDLVWNYPLTLVNAGEARSMTFGVKIGANVTEGQTTVNQITTSPPNPIVETAIITAGYFMVLTLLGVASIRDGWVFPSIALFGGLLLMLVVWSNFGTMFPNQAAGIVAAAMPIVPMGVGGINLGNTVRISKTQRAADPDGPYSGSDVG